jgi:hypothetical protein
MLCAAVTGEAQITPQEQARVQPGNLVYQGSFTLPATDGAFQSPAEKSSLTYGGFALALGPDGQSLYYGCHDWHSMLARVSIPAIGASARVVEPCTTVPNLAAVDGADSGARSLGGSLWWNGRLALSGYAYYDADIDASASHFFGPSIGKLSGPVRLSGSVPGMVAGYMGVVPQEWRSLLGGPALTGQCCLSIISRTSYGPSISVFDPDDLGVESPVPSHLLIGYTQQHQLSEYNVQSTLFNTTARIGGVAFPAGTRSVLFIGRIGTGPVCYGTGSACGDPAFDSSGYHAFPYQQQVWAYDANDLLAVKQGTKAAWELRPYATWTLPDLPNADGRGSLRSAFYDQATRRLFVVAENGGSTPRVHVYVISTAVLQPPLAATPELCGDGIDNDHDGLIDESCPSATAVPDAPVRLAGQVRGTNVSFAWSAPLTGAAITDYVLIAGLAPGRVDYTLPVGAALQFTVPKVGIGKYFVRVRARNVNGLGPESNEVAVTVGCRDKPQSMTALTSYTSDGLVTLKWSDPDGCSGTTYQVSLEAAAGATNAARQTQLLVSSVPSVTTLMAPGTYSARVTATTDTGSSTVSSAIHFEVTAPGCAGPALPLTLAAQVVGRNVRLVWSPLQPSLAKRLDQQSPITYTLDVGSVAGATNIAAFPMGRASSMATVAPPGTYFVRIRSSNVCGAGAASNELRLRIP